MNKCFKCGAEFEGNFCPQCGATHQETKTCPQCGKILDGQAKFCNECGHSFVQQQAENNTAQEQTTAVHNINQSLSKILYYAPLVLYVLWAILLWAFYSAKLVVDPFGFTNANLYQLLKDDMHVDIFPVARSLIAFGVIANIYCILLGFMQWKKRLGSKLYIGSFVLQLVVFICAIVANSKVKAFIGDDGAGNFMAVVVSPTVVFSVLEAVALFLRLKLPQQEQPVSNKKKDKHSTKERIITAIKNFVQKSKTWIKRHKILATGIAVALVVCLVLSIVLPLTLGNIFRASRVAKINIGDSYEQVEEILGKPYKANEYKYEYYSNNMTKKLNKMQELEEKMDHLTSFGELEKLAEQEEELQAEIDTIEYQYIQVNFANGKVTSVVFDNHAQNNKKDDTAKEVNEITLGTKNTVDIIDIINEKVAVRTYFKDGSYNLAALPSNATASNLGDRYSSIFPKSATITWTDSNGEHSQPVKFDESNFDFSYRVNNYTLELHGTIPTPQIYAFFSITDYPWEGRTIKSISLDKNVDYIPDIDTLVSDTSSLERIDVDSNNPNYSSVDGILFSKDRSRLIYMPPKNNALITTDWYNSQPDGLIYASTVLLTYKGTMPENYQIIVAEGTTRIADNAFKGETNLSYIVFPNTLTIIGDYAFYDCGIIAVTIPEGVIKIGQEAFAYCTNLEIIEWNAVDCIGIATDYYHTPVFYRLDKLKSIVIGENVCSIRGYIFTSGYTQGIYGYDVHISDLTAWFNISFSSVENNPMRGGTRLLINGEVITGDIVLPDNITSIPLGTFKNSTIMSITIPTSVTYIGAMSFGNCEYLNAVYISDLVSWCKVEFGGNPLACAEYLYVNGEIVTDIVIPREVTTINNAFAGYKNAKSITINDGVVSIGKSAFSGCSGLESVTIPTSVKSIGELAFNSCFNLKSVYISDLVAWSEIEMYSFGGADNPMHYANNLYLNGEVFQGDISLPNGIQTIPYGTFKNSLITSITIPRSVTFLENYAFYNCTNLESVIWESNSSLIYIGDYAFYGCSQLTSITIPQSVREIYQYAFYGCSNLQEVIFEYNSQVTDINWMAFYECGIKKVFFGGTKDQWSQINFGYCYGLDYITRYYYSQVEPGLNADGTAYDDNYWHWAEDGVTPEIWVYNKDN